MAKILVIFCSPIGLSPSEVSLDRSGQLVCSLVTAHECGRACWTCHFFMLVFFFLSWGSLLHFSILSGQRCDCSASIFHHSVDDSQKQRFCTAISKAALKLLHQTVNQNEQPTLQVECRTVSSFFSLLFFQLMCPFPLHGAFLLKLYLLLFFTLY